MTRRIVSCVESDKLIADSLSVVGGHHNYMKGNPDFTDPRGRAETVTIWETADGEWLTNTLDADGCTHYVEPAPLNFSTMSDAEIVGHVKEADIEGHIETDCHPEYGSSQPGHVYVYEDGTVSGQDNGNADIQVSVWVNTIDEDTSTIEVTDDIERFV